MRAFDWFRLFQQYAHEHDKHVFTLTELAHVSGASPLVLGVTLHRLHRQGVVVRLARGLYGAAPVPAEVLLPYLDPCAYITASSALHHRGHITQRPTIHACFTNRRHSCRRRRTRAGTFHFLTIGEPIYSFPRNEPYPIAPPEQAFCDYVYRCRLENVGARGLTLRRLHELRREVIRQLLPRYPHTVRDYATAILDGRESPWDGPPARRRQVLKTRRTARTRARGRRRHAGKRARADASP